MKIFSNIVKTICNLILLLVFFFPFYWMLSTAFKTLGETMTFPPALFPANPQWENFLHVIEVIPFGHYLINSCITTIAVVVLQMLTTVPAAYAFSQYDFKGKPLLFGLTLITMMIPAQLVFMPLFILFSQFNMINTYASLILPFAGSAFGIFLLRQRFNQVPKELLEAARLDKASELKIIWKIFLPLSRPVLVTLALLTFISKWNDYFWPLVLTTNDTVRTLPMGIVTMTNAESGTPYHLLMAGNVLISIPIIVIYLFAHKHIIKAFTYMGDK